MIIREKNFNQAGIHVHEGTLIVNIYDKQYLHLNYNVVIIGPDLNGEYIVTSEEPKLAINIPSLNRENYNIDELTEDSLETYKPLFGKPKLIPKTGWLEFKERTKRTYTTNKIIIKE